MSRGLLIAVLLALSAGALADNFPRPAALQPAVDFWTRIYTEVSTDQGFIHDSNRLDVIYETLNLPPYASNAKREHLVNQAKERIAEALTTVGRGKRDDLSPVEARVLAAWPTGTSGPTLLQAARDVRFQLGQSDRFRAGLVRSRRWTPFIREVLNAQGLPPELEVLPHVESSFNPDAWSRVAAAGMWQFMPYTARHYMRVDHVVDQRMDPFTATEGAVRLLKRNYAITGTWPLALTSYNHGTSGVLRAARAVGSKDIGVIVSNYSGPAFGFASRNFYASFLAVLDVDRNAERYFGKLRLDTPVDYDEAVLADFVPAQALADATGVDLKQIRQHNPALREMIWSGEKYVPRGYTLRIPRDQLQMPLDTHIAAVPASLRFDHQQPDLTHKIAPGESLWVIARRYGTSVARLKSLNGLRSNNIRAGKTLILPGNVMPEPPLAGTTTRVASTASPGPGIYVIRKGDSLWSIARRFKVSQQQLLAWNDISEQQYLQPGQQLMISGDSLLN